MLFFTVIFPFLRCLVVISEYFASSRNPHYTELMQAVVALQEDRDRDVKFLIDQKPIEVSSSAIDVGLLCICLSACASCYFCLAVFVFLCAFTYSNLLTSVVPL